jgi:large subunit ribosomal protein L9
MKIILKKDVRKLGRAGDVKTVKDGYARNFLIPNKLAELATDGAVRTWEAAQEKRKKKIEQENKVLKQIAEKISALTLSFTRTVGEEGQMFGSVAKSDIIKSLKAANIDIDREAIDLPSSIKSIGNFEVNIYLNHDVSAKLKIVVTPQTN